MCVVAAACLTASKVHSQGSTDHIPGKIYVIRISPLHADTDSMSRSFTEVMHRLNSVDGMMQHIKNNLYLMRAASDDRYFIGYFHADRQSKDALTEDFNLLTWLFHGHHVLIVPIEDVKSPAQQIPPTSGDGSKSVLPALPWAH